MTPVPALVATRDVANTAYHTRTESLPRVRIDRHGPSVDHPDPQAGEPLMAKALGVADRHAMDGLLRQLTKASTVGRRPDKINLAFMISMIESIAPKDSIESMLVAQMVSIHVAAMRCANHLAKAGDAERQDSASRGLARLTRAFAALVEALNRRRANAPPEFADQITRIERVIVYPARTPDEEDRGQVISDDRA